MGRVIVTEFISLDGVVEDPGGAEKGKTDFPHGGWTFDFDRGKEGDEFKVGELRAADTQLLGRVTYEGFAKAWPGMRTQAGEFGEKMNAMPKFVVSVSRLKTDISGDILIAGSAKLVQGLTEYGLVDQYRLMTFPIVLGTGKRLFEGGVSKTKLRLVDNRPVGKDGVVILTYEPVHG